MPATLWSCFTRSRAFPVVSTSSAIINLSLIDISSFQETLIVHKKSFSRGGAAAQRSWFFVAPLRRRVRNLLRFAKLLCATANGATFVILRCAVAPPREKSFTIRQTPLPDSQRRPPSLRILRVRESLRGLR